MTERVLKLAALYQRDVTVTPGTGELTLTGCSPDVVTEAARRAIVSWAELEVPDAPPQTEAEQKVLDKAIEAQEELVLKQIVALRGTGGGSSAFGTGKLTIKPQEPSDPSATEPPPPAHDGGESSSG